MTIASVVFLAGVGGYAVGQLQTSSTSDPATPIAGERVVVTERAALDEPALRAMIRTTIRDELHQPTTEPVGQADSTTAAGSEPPTREHLDARHGADQFIATAIARGVWGEDDRDRFATLVQQLSTSERLEAMRPLVVAINEQRVSFDFVGAAFQ